MDVTQIILELHPCREENPLPEGLPEGEGLEVGRYADVFGTLDVRRGEPSPSGRGQGRGQGEGLDVDSSLAVIGLGGSTRSSLRFSADMVRKQRRTSPCQRAYLSSFEGAEKRLFVNLEFARSGPNGS